MCTGTYAKQSLVWDTGWRPNETKFAFDTVITRVSSDGFYATDVGEKRGFNSIFAFNFSAPPRMRVCDRMKSYGGTAAGTYCWNGTGL